MGKVLYFSRRGKRSPVCKDSVYFRDGRQMGVYSLADGLNSKKWSKQGAEAVQRALASEAEKQGKSLLARSELKIKTDTIEIIRRTLYNLCEEKGCPDDYASTLMTLFISRETGMFCFIHIGDGLIVKETADGELSVISHPHNGITRQFTYTTAHEQLERYTRVGKMPLKDIRRLFMLTDGAAFPLYDDRKLTRRGRYLLGRGTACVLEELKWIGPADDHSMVEIDVDDREG